MRLYAVELVVRWVLLAIAFGTTSWILSDQLEVSGGVSGHLLAAAVFGLVNTFIGPVIRILTLPLTILTLGLFSIVVNAVLLMVAAWFTDAIEIDGFGPALVGALVLAIVSAFLNAVVTGRSR